jgi:hypothetical protein
LQSLQVIKAARSAESIGGDGSLGLTSASKGSGAAAGSYSRKESSMSLQIPAFVSPSAMMANKKVRISDEIEN